MDKDYDRFRNFVCDRLDDFLKNVSDLKQKIYELDRLMNDNIGLLREGNFALGGRLQELEDMHKPSKHPRV